MTASNDIRRLRNGAIDTDSYRAGATALRRQAMRDAFRLKLGFGVTVVMVAMLGFAAVMTSLRQTNDAALQAAGETARISESGHLAILWLDRFTQLAKPTLVK